MPIAKQLLSAKRDEHADHNDSDFARELAPAVQWFG
jgi:hypothetical protein